MNTSLITFCNFPKIMLKNDIGACVLGPSERLKVRFSLSCLVDFTISSTLLTTGVFRFQYQDIHRVVAAYPQVSDPIGQNLFG